MLLRDAGEPATEVQFAAVKTPLVEAELLVRQKLMAVEALFALTEPFRVAVADPTSEASLVIAVGAPAVNERVVPTTCGELVLGQ